MEISIMRKRKNNLGQQTKQCGNVTNLLYNKMYPNNDVYNEITKALSSFDGPVLPSTGEGEIAANKAFVVDVGDIDVERGESVKDSICALIDAKDVYYGDLHSAFKRSDSDKIKEYYIDTSLCYGWDRTTGRQIIITNSTTVLEEIPVVGRHDALRNKNYIWLEFDMYSIYRLYPRTQGFFLETELINLSNYYI